MIATSAGVELKSLELQDEGATYRIEYDQSAITPSTAVVASLATVRDVDPLEMPPLQRSVDPDALDDLVGDEREGTGEVTFTFTTGGGHEVTIGNHGVIGIDPPTSVRVGDQARRERLE